MTHTLENYRDDFPVLQQSMNGKPLAFLDSAASAQKPSFVIEKMNEILTSRYSNIHRGLYKISQDLTADYEVVRSKVSDFIGAQNEREIVFTRNSTESINLVAQSYGRTFLKKGDELKLIFPQEKINPKSFEHLKFKYFFLQPMDGPNLKSNIKKTYAFCDKNKRWNVSLQLHKIVGMP